MQDGIEYIGININSDGTFLRKVYSKQVIQKESVRNNPIIKPLLEDDRIGYCSQAFDGNCIRYDMKLSRRDKNNVVNVIKYFENIANNYRLTFDINEVIHFSQLESFPHKDFIYGALYFVGFILLRNNIECIKTHYSTRKFYEFEKDVWLEKFDNDYYLNKMSLFGISALDKLLPITREAINEGFGNLYLTGTDYFCSLRKYKIYLKACNRIPINEKKFFDFLSKKSFPCVFDNLLLNKVENLLVKEHLIGLLEGIAFAIDSNMEKSINLYFNPNILRK